MTKTRLLHQPGLLTACWPRSSIGLSARFANGMFRVRVPAGPFNCGVAALPPRLFQG